VPGVCCGRSCQFRWCHHTGKLLPTEPAGFGSDPEVVWDLLKGVQGWDCIDVNSDWATALGEIIKRELGVRIRYYGDICYALSKAALNFENRAVRQLTLEDLKLLESALLRCKDAVLEIHAVCCQMGLWPSPIPVPKPSVMRTLGR